MPAAKFRIASPSLWFPRFQCARGRICSHKGVSTTPGAKPLTVILCLASSRAADWVREITGICWRNKERCWEIPGGRRWKRVHDLASAALRDHLARSFLHADQHAQRVHPQNTVPVFFRSLHERLDLVDSRIVENDIEFAKFGDVAQPVLSPACGLRHRTGAPRVWAPALRASSAEPLASASLMSAKTHWRLPLPW